MSSEALHIYCLVHDRKRWEDIGRNWFLGKTVIRIKCCHLKDNEGHSFFSPANVLYGPLHTKQAVNMFLGAVEAAKKEGGTVVYGGKVRTARSSAGRFPPPLSGWRVPDCPIPPLFLFVRGIRALNNDIMNCMGISGRTHENLRAVIAFELNLLYGGRPSWYCRRLCTRVIRIIFNGYFKRSSETGNQKNRHQKYFNLTETTTFESLDVVKAVFSCMV